MTNNVKLEDARLIFLNFQGEEGQYNRKGDRNFSVLLEPDIAKQMIDDGWNVKFLKPRDEEDEPTAYIQVSVSYKYRAPRVVLLTSQGRTDLDEDSVEVVDYTDIDTVDLIITPYHWNVNGLTGIKAYLKSMFIKVNEDELEMKYASVPVITNPPYSEE